MIQKINEHKDDKIWLHNLYVRICRKHEIDPEPIINESTINEWELLHTFNVK